jgi:hypothetical protein
LASSVEYSVSEETGKLGTMVRGDAGVVQAIGTFVSGTVLAGDWYSAAARMFQHIGPIASLFRVDWSVGRLVATTLYLKFPQPPNGAAVAETLACARPFRWHGPSPAAVAEAVGLAGPTGIALRGSASGSGHVAVYYLVEATPGTVTQNALSRLLEAADVSCAAKVVADSVTLAPSCPLSVVGLDGGSPGALKLDWGEVPSRVARAVVKSKGASHGALTRFDELSNNLRARWLSYLGMKYMSTGFAGWRAYFSIEPHRYIPAGLPSMQGRERASARMPHY